MQYLLSRTSRAILTRLATEKTLCAFDFDGTLSPIVDHPDQAGMREPTRSLLRRLAAVYPCIILSGRARGDVISKLGDVQVAKVIGNHGAESEDAAYSGRAEVRNWAAMLQAALGSIEGVWIEDKGFSLAVHYRQSPRKVEARKRILEAAQNLHGVRVFGGKYVVNLVASREPNKGEALATERDRLGCDWVLFVGDDENDEDAFALGGNIVAVRVGWSRRSHARYYVRSQPEVDELLEQLILLRESGGQQAD